MSQNNYRNYNNYHNQNNRTSCQPTHIVETSSTSAVTNVQPAPVLDAEVVQPIIVEEPKPVFGVVSGCAKLNIRKSPSPNGNVICTVNENTKLMIILDESTAEWYKVCNSAGLNGFCMKKYVTVEE